MTGRLVHRCLIASPLLFGAIGCVGGPQVISANGSFNGLANQAQVRSQQPNDVQPAAVVLPPTTLADGTVAVRAIAYVNHSPVYENELRDSVNQRAREFATLDEPERTKKRKQIEEQELDRLIERELILEIALAQLKKVRPKSVEELQKEADKEFEKHLRKIKEAYSIQTDAQLKDFMSAQGMSLDALRRQSERTFLSMEYMRNVIFPKMQALPMTAFREYYDKHPEEFQESNRAKWQGILVDASRFANRADAARYAQGVAARLQSGEDFSATAAGLRQSGVNIQLSDVGVGEKAGEIQPSEVEPALFRMKPGEIGVVELPGGFQIVRVLERGYAGKKAFTVELQAEVRKKVQASYWDREYRNVIEEMKSKAVIQKMVP
jgi:hypothetical protein